MSSDTNINYAAVYDIFISYRRDGGDQTAILIRDRLVSLGYKVFLDIEALSSGSFNDKLFDVIEKCKDVVLVCSKDALERCKNEDDWVRVEICHALKHDRNIIPVMLRGFDFPAELPDSLEALRYKNGVNATQPEYFDEAVKRIQKFLISKPVTTQHPETTVDKSQANLELHYERGVIVNNEDKSRNISFRVDTVNELFDTFIREITAIQDVETAKKILWNMGYNSGKKFGSTINKQWDNENVNPDFDSKIKRWCEFDSVVGWGRFKSNITVDTDNGAIDGTLSLSENFLCYGRKKNQERLCNYILGYCTGVLGELLGDVEINIRCDEKSCPLINSFKKECIFTVALEVP